jgi:hypothetical protein
MTSGITSNGVLDADSGWLPGCAVIVKCRQSQLLSELTGLTAAPPSYSPGHTLSSFKTTRFLD